ncbi:MAG: KH domain-containing protein [Candidatus Aenigmarchaeota archaeon]|nr:KH domain-containing protein [Candidatus Aenigmarchaeota archaeon]
MNDEEFVREEKEYREERRDVKRRLVIPGDLLGKGKAGHGTYEDDDNVYSRFVGLAEDREGIHMVIPLCGVYNPKRGDGVIGKIEEIIFSKWIIDINSPYEAVLTLSEGVEDFVDMTKTELTKFYDYNDIIFAEIASITKTKNIQLTMRSRKCRKLRGGRLMKVTPAKVPRIIGKGGSMVEMIKEMTGTQIVVGQNGIVWVKGDNEDIAAEAILEINEKSHIHGLTEHIKAILANKLKKNDDVQRG